MIKNILAVILTSLTCLSCSSQQATSESKNDVQDDVYTTASGKQVTFTFIKHASLEIKYDGLSIQVDPVKQLPPETDYSKFPKASFILVTHEHFDHFDKDAIATLSDEDTQVVLNKRCAEMLGSGKAMNNGDTLKLRDDITLEAVPAYNTTPGREQFHPKARDNGYVLNLDGLRIYIAGDTEDIPEMALLKEIDIAFMPCNQPYTMTPEQLVRAARMFSPKVIYPYHYNDTPVEKIQELLSDTKIEVKIRGMK
jgi:L-ascorbate metabolism protein UlaG (beta-lactamase superfamily)